MNDRDTEYHWVKLGPIPGLPSWHVQSGWGQHAFPTRQAAERFAKAHEMPGRPVELVSSPKG